jgi:hypothetical protein
VKQRRRRREPVPAPVERRTPYALARVVADPARPSRRTLLLDGHEAGQVDLADPRALGFGYMRRIADVLDAIRPSGRPLDAVHVGGGAFALPRYLEATRPRSRQDVLERDPGVVRLARERLGLRPSPRLRIRVGDAAAQVDPRPRAQEGEARVVGARRAVEEDDEEAEPRIVRGAVLRDRELLP